MNTHRRIESFSSRKNAVWLVENRRTGARQVKKTFTDADRCQKEAEIITALQKEGVSVPALLAHEEKTLRLSYLASPTAYTVLTECEENGQTLTKAFLTAIVTELQRIHQTDYFSSRGYALCDVNWRNILWDGRRVTWLDFEDCGPGTLALDLGGLVAFLLTYDPAMTEYKRTCASNLRRLILALTPVLPQALDAQIHHWLDFLGERRNRQYDGWFPGE